MNEALPGKDKLDLDLDLYLILWTEIDKVYLGVHIFM